MTPGTGEYVFGSPLFEKATLHLENGKTLTIDASQNSQDNVYIHGIKYRGKEVRQNFITHSELLKGGRLKFSMGAEPDTLRGTERGSFPYSMSLSN